MEGGSHMNRLPNAGILGVALSWRVVTRLFLTAATVLAIASCQPAKKANNGPAVNNDALCEQKYDSATCTNSSNCEWTGSLCSGSTSYCAKFTSSNNCPVSCQWNTTTNLCQKLPLQSTSVSCQNYSQANCGLVAGCAWNGTSCINSGGTGSPTTGYPSPTTGYPSPTTGYPSPTTGVTPAPVTQCETLGIWQCLINKDCKYNFLPSPGCTVMQQQQ